MGGTVHSYRATSDFAFLVVGLVFVLAVLRFWMDLALAASFVAFDLSARCPCFSLVSGQEAVYLSTSARVCHSGWLGNTVLLCHGLGDLSRAGFVLF